MPNPADLLLATFHEWNSRQSRTVSCASTRKDDSTLQQHRRCVSYLNQIDEILPIMEEKKRVAKYRDMFPRWVAHVFRYENNWQAADSPGDRHMMDMLDSLAEAMEEFVPRLDEEKFSDLSEYLDSIEDALNDDDSLPLIMKDSVLAAVHSIRSMIENFSVVGDYQLVMALEALLGKLAHIAATTKERKRWFGILDGFLIPYAVNQFPPLPFQNFFELLPGN